MRVISTFHPPSSVCCSQRCRLSKDQEYLVIGRPDRLEAYSLRTEGLRYECSIEVWGQVLTLKPVIFQGCETHKIVLLTDHPHPKLVLISLSVSNNGIASFVEESTVDLQESGFQPSEFLNDIIVDPSASVVVVACYARKLKIVLLECGVFDENYDVSVEQFLLSIAFLPTSSRSLTLGILHLDDQQRPQIISRDLELAERELSPSPSRYFPGLALSPESVRIGNNLPILIPVYGTDRFSGGLIVLGGREIQFFDTSRNKNKGLETGKRNSEGDRNTSRKEHGSQKQLKRRKAKATVLWPWDEFSAWCEVDCTKYLLADRTGKLALMDFHSTFGFTILPLGQGNIATTLTYLTSQIIYLGSFLADSQLLRLHESPFKDGDSPTLPIPPDFPILAVSSFDELAHKDKRNTVVASLGSYIEVIEEYPNLAPVSDAVLFDPDNSGQPQIVTCSGGGISGTLKIISNGASFFESVTMPMKNVISIFPLRKSYDHDYHTHIVVSTPKETQLFRLESQTVSHIDISMLQSLSPGVPTLAVSNIAKHIPKTGIRSSSTYANSSLIVQVTPREVLLADIDQPMGIPLLIGESWMPKVVDAWRNKDIVAADINPSQILLALSSGIIVLLNAHEHDGFTIRAQKSFECEIATVSCRPINPSHFYSKIAVVGFWDSNAVHIVSLGGTQTSFQTLYATPSFSALPRSVLLHNFGSSYESGNPDYKPHLLVGLTDGNLVSYAYDDTDNVLKSRAMVSLGHTAVRLTTYTVNGISSVFAYGGRAEILYWSMQRLQYSSVPVKDILWAASFNNTNTPSCLALCMRDKIVIGRVRDLKQIDVRGVPFGLDIPQRIIPIPTFAVFGVTFSQEPAHDESNVTGKFRLLDWISFNCLAEYFCESGEEISTVKLVPAPSGVYICLGTVFGSKADVEPTKGRLVFLRAGVDNHSSSAIQLSEVAKLPVHGCVYALAILDQLLAVAVDYSVTLYKISGFELSSPCLHVEKKTSWDHNYVVTSLECSGSTLIVGDVIHSISILELKDGNLSIKSRDHSPLWPFRIGSLHNGGIVGGNVDRVLFTFRSQLDEDRIILERDGSYNVHELINKFIPGSLTQPDETAVVNPQQIFFTSTGRIGVISDLDPKFAFDMTAFQSNMEKVVQGLGHTKHDMLRATITRYESQPSLGFLDGQYLEQFLNLKSDLRRRVLEGANEAERIKLTEAQVEQILEGFQRIH